MENIHGRTVQKFATGELVVKKVKGTNIKRVDRFLTESAPSSKKIFIPEGNWEYTNGY